MDRSAKLRSLVEQEGFGLEIGPSHSPVFPKFDGYNVETLDYASTEKLREVLGGRGVDVTHVEDVDYVSDGGSILDTVPRRHEYDYVFSSHALEHVVDIIDYITSCDALLKPNGVIAFALPDKRYTFDVLRHNSTTGEVLDAHLRSRNRHTLAAVYDFEASFAKLDDRQVWGVNDTGPMSLMHQLDYPKARLEDAARPDAPYHDVHGWVFTPASFQLIMHELNALGFIDFTVDQVVLRDGGGEFFVTLKRAGRSSQDRLQLRLDELDEQTVSGLQVLASRDPLFAELFARVRRERPVQ